MRMHRGDLGNNSRKNEGMEPKQKQYSVVDVTGDRSKVRCCKEQYCIGTWNVHESRQIGSGQTGDGKSEHRHSRKWAEWVNLTQMTIIATTVGRNPLEEME